MTTMKEVTRYTKDGYSKTELVYEDTEETQYQRIQRLLKQYED
jgi:hypothetical protein